MSAVHVVLRATDDASVEKLRDFLHRMKVQESLSRPSSNEAVAEAVAAAERSVEEIERDAKSDRGVPASWGNLYRLFQPHDGWNNLYMFYEFQRF